jgi:hypothetical protein
MDKYLYIFLDEGGNLDFSPNGTKLFLVTSLAKERPFEAYKELAELEQGLHIESFTLPRTSKSLGTRSST